MLIKLKLKEKVDFRKLPRKSDVSETKTVMLHFRAKVPDNPLVKKGVLLFFNPQRAQYQRALMHYRLHYYTSFIPHR